MKQMCFVIGMGRSGTDLNSSTALIREVNNLPNIELEGIFSHFASSENDPEFTKIQERRFLELNEGIW